MFQRTERERLVISHDLQRTVGSIVWKLLQLRLLSRRMIDRGRLIGKCDRPDRWINLRLWLWRDGQNGSGRHNTDCEKNE
jgi:hypothetical protein